MSLTLSTFELIQIVEVRWPGQVQCELDSPSVVRLTCTCAVLAAVCSWLFRERDLSFAGLIVEESESKWDLHYGFYGSAGSSWVQVSVAAPLSQRTFPSIVESVPAADWYEREAEDLFGLVFEGHPRLGDFVLHNDAWQEGVEPMRHAFDADAAMQSRRPDTEWRPRRIVHEPGAFVMPVGPIYSGVTESVHFLLETVGEDVIRSTPRLFYKWRSIEKLAEGKKAEDGLLLAERFAATTAFAHGWAFCHAVEKICGTQVPERAQTLRIFLAELERIRHHAGAVAGICDSTALVVAHSQAAILEEELLRISCELTGHRYLFGMLALGGLSCNLPDEACDHALERSMQILEALTGLQQQLRLSSSFLDRLEEVGSISYEEAKTFGLVGPVARASGLARDLRREQPYFDGSLFPFEVPREIEGDGYARLRVLFDEVGESIRIMKEAVANLGPGEIRRSIDHRSGAAWGWVEAPRGAAFHWVRLDDEGVITRYRIMPPSFPNWHGFHLAVENFAFQDFPIILSTFDVSVAENDR